jgi:hypothetical protein
VLIKGMRRLEDDITLFKERDRGREGGRERERVVFRLGLKSRHE